MVKDKNDKEQFKFEEGLKRLEKIVDNLERGDIPLEESLKLYEEGVRLIRLLQTRLQEAETKIEKLLEEKDGTPILENFIPAKVENTLFSDKIEGEEEEEEDGLFREEEDN